MGVLLQEVAGLPSCGQFRWKIQASSEREEEEQGGEDPGEVDSAMRVCSNPIPSFNSLPALASPWICASYMAGAGLR